ncbi:MAG: DNA mismatch repair endonuclease MutL [Chlamydiae bacterium]|nr:DNA mismatch repair endonuclease MutL [Chlamydiota bacterium]
MPAKIRVLSEETINQIAAGEIIENPASLIKELIENSIDANATKIEIEVHGGGHLFIEVRDNGCGMNKDDAVLCFERHATSKISKFTDLLKLTSMGFRGEALASIGAVAKVEIETNEDNSIGTKVVCHGGKMLKVDPFSRTQGTTIRVQDLFYNVPARKKFQKSSAQSTGDISKMLTKVSLAHPDVSFLFTSSGKTLLETSRLKEKRIEEVLGKDFLRETTPITFEKDGYKISGIVGTPLNVRSNRLQQHLVINKRPVISALIERAIQNAFGTRIGTKEYPLFVLWMEFPPHLVDVNVHPQKIFVRFCEEDKVHALVKLAVEESFFTNGKMAVFSKTERPDSFFEEPIIYAQAEKPASVAVEFRGQRVDITDEKAVPSFQINEKKLVEEEIEIIGFYDDIALVKVPQMSPIFLEERLMFVHIQRLDAKVQFERILVRLKEGKGCDMEELLFPEVLNFSKGEEELIMKHEPLLKKLGIAIRSFGKQSLIIDALSPLFSMSAVRKILEELLMEFSKEFSFENICKILVRYRSYTILSKDEIKHLLKEVLKKEDPFYTPNGKLIMKAFNKEEFFGK